MAQREQLIWDLLANDRASSAFKQVAESMGEAEKKGGSLLATVARFAAFGMVANKIWDMTKSASDLSEALNLNERIFKGNAAVIQDWAEGGANAFGLSTSAGLEFAAQIGGALMNLGYDMDDASQASQTLIERAADMASAFNKDVTQAIFAVQAGLRGETEPLRQFNVFLDEGRIKAEALAQGLYKGTGALDAYAKAMAIQALIMKDTSAIAGDFALTSDGLANSQRRLSAHMENLKTTIGQSFLPIAEAAFGIFNDMTEAANDLDPAIGQFAATFALVGSAAAALGPKLDGLWQKLTGGISGAGGIKNALMTVGKVAAATAVLVAGIELMQAHAQWERLTGAVEAFQKEIGNIDLATFDEQTKGHQATIEALRDRYEKYQSVIQGTAGWTEELGIVWDAVGQVGLRFNTVGAAAESTMREIEVAEAALAAAHFQAARKADEQAKATANLQATLGTTKPGAEALNAILEEMKAAFEGGASAADLYRKALQTVTDTMWGNIDVEHQYQAAIDDLAGSLETAQAAGTTWTDILGGLTGEGRAVAASVRDVVDSIIAKTAQTYIDINATGDQAAAAQGAKVEFEKLWAATMYGTDTQAGLADQLGITDAQLNDLTGSMEDYNVLDLILKYATTIDQTTGPGGPLGPGGAATGAVQEWNGTTLTEKYLTTHPEETVESVREGMAQLSNWNAFLVDEKPLPVVARPATSGVQEALGAVGWWNKAVISNKYLQATPHGPGGVVPGVGIATGAIGNFNAVPAFIKNLLGNAGGILGAVGQAIGGVGNWNRAPSHTKEIKGDNRWALVALTHAIGNLGQWNAMGVATKNIHVSENSYSAYANAQRNINNVRGRTVYVDVIERYIRARAEGGPVFAGSQYLVGERGPEMFVPQSNGWIVRNEDLRATSPNQGGRSTALAGSPSVVPIVLQLDSRTVWRGLVDLQKRQGVSLGLGA